ncbi:MAG: endonuclease domain-containing protein [Cytophagales bacterium]|nr:endonuclease domain-containing protein [Cytophagales bacterium]
MDSRKMFYGANPDVFEKAKTLRKHMTKEEKILWNELRANKLEGLRFKPQHPIQFFMADFYCHKARLVIEIDGASHIDPDQQEYDEQRTLQLESLGLTVIRFKNWEVSNELEGVLSTIKRVTADLIVRNQSLTPTLKGGIDYQADPNTPLQGVGGSINLAHKIGFERKSESHE